MDNRTFNSTTSFLVKTNKQKAPLCIRVELHFIFIINNRTHFTFSFCLLRSALLVLHLDSCFFFLQSFSLQLKPVFCYLQRFSLHSKTASLAFSGFSFAVKASFFCFQISFCRIPIRLLFRLDVRLKFYLSRFFLKREINLFRLSESVHTT